MSVEDVDRFIEEERRAEAGVWTTKDGRKIPVAEMEDIHLVNTIRMVRRVGGVTVDEFLTMLSAACSGRMGDGAQMALEHEIAGAKMMPPAFDAVLREAKARGLEVDP